MNLVRWVRTQWDRVSGATLVAIGAIAIVLGWQGVSDEGLTAQQIPYVISGGIGGLFLLGVGGILWLSADLRDEWRKLDAIERSLAPAETVSLGLPEDDPFAPAAAVAPEAPTVVGGPAVKAPPVKATKAATARTTKPRARTAASRPSS